MERMRTIVFLLAIGIVSMVVVSPGGAASAPQNPVSDPALTAQWDQSSCPCACSPLAGAWIAKLSSSATNASTSSSVTNISPFKFLPVDAACNRFAVNAQVTLREAKVLKAWPDANDITEFVGTACRTEKTKVEFTAIGYGIEKRFACRCNDKVAFIAIMSGCIEVPEKNQTCPQCQDAECGCTTCVCTCEEPKELDVSFTVAYYDACQDQDGDGFPDACNAVICVAQRTKLKRVELLPQCTPGESFVTRLSSCEDCISQATARAFFKTEEDELKMCFTICVSCIKDVSKAEIFVAAQEGEQGTPAALLFPRAPAKEKEGEFCGLLACGVLTANDLIGPLKNKKISDLVKAMEEGRATVVIKTKKFPNGEICGCIEDP